DFCQHLSTAPTFDATHFFLPAEHLFRTTSGYAGSTARTTASTKASAMASKSSLSPNVAHGASESSGYFVSSLVKHPFSGFGPPSYFAIALVMQSLSFGVTPLLSAVTWHLSRPPPLPATHLFFPATHLPIVITCAPTGVEPRTSAANALATTPTIGVRNVRMSALLS